MRNLTSILLVFLFFSTSSYGQLIVKDQESTPNTLLQVNDEGIAGSITLPSLASIGSNTSKIYNINGKLHWNGSELATGSTFSLPYSATYSVVGTGAAFQITNTGEDGTTSKFILNNSSNLSGHALELETNGAASALYVNVNNSSLADGIHSKTGEGGGAAIYGESSGSNAGRFESNGENNYAACISASANHMGNAGFFSIYNQNNDNIALEASTQGPGTATHFSLWNTNSVQNSFYFFSKGLGDGIHLEIDNTSNSNEALDIQTNGTGTAVLVNHTGASGDMAVFRSSGSNVARIDKTGKGYFNGGTQTGGADIAESFDVEGYVQDYEPGDVLVISTKSNRRVEKSLDSYSSLVIGVYATKPGVLLTENYIDDQLTYKVPVGIVGVIPTKVTTENGNIKRGDMLVSSSKIGHAMKGTERSRMLGSVIGKALEPFSGKESGIIDVLVNIK